MIQECNNSGYCANISPTAELGLVNSIIASDLNANSRFSFGDSNYYSEPTSPIINTVRHVEEEAQLYTQQVYATEEQHYYVQITSNSVNNNNINNAINNGNAHVNYNNNVDVPPQLFDRNCYSAFDYAPQTSTTNPESIMSEAANNSDTSIADLNIDAEVGAPDEAYTYLQGLNSDNVMQFSQQSVMEELMRKEQLDRKPNLGTLPTFEQHDYGGYNFQLKVQKESKSKLSWVYSEKLNKVYIRMNQLINIDAVFKPKMPMQQLRLRAFLCFVKEVSEPVLRCQNHMSKDIESHADLRPYLLRCENPFTEYCGEPEGRSINQRYSVLVPLNMCITPQDDKTIKQTIALKFTCQNSCIGRKETSIVFLLEGLNGEILAQRILDVKICSCPKRDRMLDETSKRKLDEDICPRQTKMCKRSPSTETEFVKDDSRNRSKEEFENEDSDDENIKDFNLISMARSNGGVRLVLEFEDKNYLPRAVDAFFNVFADKLFKNPHCEKRTLRRFNKMRKMRDRALKI